MIYFLEKNLYLSLNFSLQCFNLKVLDKVKVAFFFVCKASDLHITDAVNIELPSSSRSVVPSFDRCGKTSKELT